MYLVGYPNLLVSLHPDYVMTHLMTPLAVDRTHVECAWAFPKDVAAKPDFDPSYAVDFWDLTNRQDWAACESVQRGLSSPHARPGPLAPDEDGVYQFVTRVARAYSGHAINNHRLHWPTLGIIEQPKLRANLVLPVVVEVHPHSWRARSYTKSHPVWETWRLVGSLDGHLTRYRSPELSTSVTTATLRPAQSTAPRSSPNPPSWRSLPNLLRIVVGSRRGTLGCVHRTA